MTTKTPEKPSTLSKKKHGHEIDLYYWEEDLKETLAKVMKEIDDLPEKKEAYSEYRDDELVFKLDIKQILMSEFGEELMGE